MPTSDAPDPQQPLALADDTIRHNARLGAIFFLVYFLLYGGFIALATWDFKLLATPVLGRVNLAIIYGLVLIGAAFVMAILYMRVCRNPEDRLGKD